MATLFDITGMLPEATPVAQAFFARSELAEAAPASGGTVGRGFATALAAWDQRILDTAPETALDIVFQIATAYEHFRPENPADFDVEGFLDAFRSIAEDAIGFLTV